MLVKVILLALVASIHARPQKDSTADTTSAHDLCPPDLRHYLLPHEYDCTKFYYCEYGLKWETPRDCAPGTEFSYELQVCVHPAQAQCTLPGVPNPITAAPPDSENDNTEIDDNNNGGNTDNNGNDGTDVDDNNNGGDENVDDNNDDGDDSTDVDDNNNNGGDGNTDVDDINNGNDDNGNTSTEVDDNNTGDDESNNSDWLDNGCPADIHVHWLLPHDDCNKFYYCNFGEKVERLCNAGLHFNPVLQVCDWPENAGCQDKNNGGGDDNDDSNTEVDDNTNGSGDDNNDDNAEVDDDNNGGDNGNDDGNTEIDDDNNGGGDDNDDGNLEVDDSDNGNTEVDDNNNSDGDDNVVEWLDNGCPADFQVHWLLPHEDCGKFYYCNFGVKVERSCSGGLHFNPLLQVCDWPENAGCESNNSGDGSTEVDNGSINDGDDNGNDNTEIDEVDDNTNGSGDDSNDDNAEVDDDNNGGDNDNDDGNTEIDDNNNSNGDDNENELLDNGCPADFNVHWLLPHKECGKFYYCVFGEKVARECSGGLHFNPVLQVCDRPENAGCESNGGEDDDNNNNSVDDDNNNSGGDDNNSGDDNNNSNDNTEIDDNNTTETPKPEHNKCADTCNVLPWAHETACDKFWRCEGENAVLVICAEGLHFNAKAGTCDFICNANCIREHVQTTSDHQGLKLFIPWNKVSDNMRTSYL